MSIISYFTQLLGYLILVFTFLVFISDETLHVKCIRHKIY